MKQLDFSTYLPSHITISILSRLPLRTISICKFVCKTWHDLLETDVFVRSHLSRSVPGLLIMQDRVFEYEDGLELERHELHYNPITNFDHTAFITPPYVYVDVQGTIDGLLFLWSTSATEDDALWICNPITLDYVEFHCPPEFLHHHCSNKVVVTHGFGSSRMTGQHKMVRISQKRNTGDQTADQISSPECVVYTLETGSWRSVSSGAPLDYGFSSFGVFFNGSLHWLVYDSEECQWISCFDLETETFTTLCSTPRGDPFERLFVLGDCLCLCTHSIEGIVIWSMKEYGVEESWTKEFVMERPDFGGGLYDVVSPLKVFKDGDVLIAWEYFLFYYSNNPKTTHQIDLYEQYTTDKCFFAIPFNPSFLSLKSFAMENVRSLWFFQYLGVFLFC